MLSENTDILPLLLEFDQFERPFSKSPLQISTFVGSVVIGIKLKSSKV